MKLRILLPIRANSRVSYVGKVEGQSVWAAMTDEQRRKELGLWLEQGSATR